MAVTIQDDMAQVIMLLPKEQQGDFATAIILYGCVGIEPDGTEPWYPTFYALKPRLDMSKKAHKNGASGASKRWNDKSADKQAIIDPYNRGSIDPYNSHSIDPYNSHTVDPYNAEYENEYEYEIKEKENIKEKEKNAKNEVNENATKGFSLHKTSHDSQKATQKPPDLSQKSTRFKKPTIEEISRYVQEKGYSVDAEKFWNYYESKGWVVGKSPMKSWTAAIATWAKNDFGSGQKKSPSEKEKEAAYAAFAEFDNYAKAHEVRLVQ